MNNESFPIPPTITKELFDSCVERNDFIPILFEWYKYTGSVCVYLACIMPESPAVRTIPRKHFSILTGLLNRCSRLMLANIALTHEGKFGETSCILDRCIAESTIKLRWLCLKNSEICFKQFMAEGLKSEIELKEKIEENIQNNDGNSLTIEKRMLSSINNLIKESGLTIEDIKQSKRMPDFASLLNKLDLDRLIYIVLQKMGSHHVHGTWPSLMFHYLEEDENGTLVPRDHECRPHVNQFIFIPLLVIEALKSFIDFIINNKEEKEVLLDTLDHIHGEIVDLNQFITDEDFKY